MKYVKSILLLLAIVVAIGTPATAQQKRKVKQRTKAELLGTYWRLFEIDGKKVETPADAREVYIKLADSKKSELEGYAGCNLITGTYKLGKETISFEAAATMRACDDMTTENYIFNALNNANRYDINGLYLLVYKGTYLLAVFEAKYYGEE